jgi:hypothetical protein
MKTIHFLRFLFYWGTGEMKLTAEIRNTWTKISSTATSSTTNPIRTEPGSKLGLRGDRPTTNCLSHGTAKTLCDNDQKF